MILCEISKLKKERLKEKGRKIERKTHDLSAYFTILGAFWEESYLVEIIIFYGL